MFILFQFRSLIGPQSLSKVLTALAVSLNIVSLTGCESVRALWDQEDSGSDGAENSPSSNTEINTDAASKEGSDRRGSSGNKKSSSQMLVKIDEQTFLFKVERLKVWKAVLDVLAPDYSITVVDLRSGIVTTDWDSYYLEGKPYRNRVMLRTKRLGTGETKLVINNKVETLRSGQWVASDQMKDEATRIIKNIAKLLGQMMPPE